MKKRLITAALLTVLITGCGKTEHDTVSEIRKTYCDVPPATVAAVSAQTTSATTAVRTDKALSVTSVSLTSATTAASTDRTGVTVESSAEWEQPQTKAEQTVSSETVNEEEAQYDIFFGILIDEDCSDFEDPPSHDLPCMLMDECRASGYGLDIQQEDGSWIFYMFDEKGQELSWEYLRHTARMDGLYVTVKGKWEDNIIKVTDLQEK